MMSAESSVASVKNAKLRTVHVVETLVHNTWLLSCCASLVEEQGKVCVVTVAHGYRTQKVGSKHGLVCCVVTQHRDCDKCDIATRVKNIGAP